MVHFLNCTYLYFLPTIAQGLIISFFDFHIGKGEPKQGGKGHYSDI